MFVYNLVDDYQLHMSHCVHELVSLRENTMERFNGLVCSRDELNILIQVFYIHLMILFFLNFFSVRFSIITILN